MAEPAKNLLGLLNGIVRRDYYNDDSITDDFLKTELYPDVPVEEFSNLRKRSSSLLKNMADADMDTNQLDAFLTSQTKKRDNALSDSDAKVYAKFWKNNKTKVHDSLVSRTQWNNSLKSMSWRIDLKTQARHIDQINQPTAIIEMKIENKDSGPTDKKVDVVRFEMDEAKMKEVLSKVEDIEKAIQKYAQQS